VIAGWHKPSYFSLRTKLAFVTGVVSKYPDAIPNNHKTGHARKTDLVEKIGQRR